MRCCWWIRSADGDGSDAAGLAPGILFSCSRRSSVGTHTHTQWITGDGWEEEEDQDLSADAEGASAAVEQLEHVCERG